MIDLFELKFFCDGERFMVKPHFCPHFAKDEVHPRRSQGRVLFLTNDFPVQYILYLSPTVATSRATHV